MTDEKDTTVIQLGDIKLKPALKSGVSGRAFMALSFTDEPYLTIQELSDICGFAPSTLRYNDSLTNLFHGQLVEAVEDEADRRRVKGYRLTEKARRSVRTVDDELEELAVRARRSVGGKKTKIHSGLSVIDGGAKEAKSNE